MKNRVRHFLGMMLWPFLALTLVSGCGGRKESENITVEVRPSAAVVTPGPDSSCLDATIYLRALQSGADTLLAISKSVSGPLVSFPTFRLTWTSSDRLYVQVIRFKITGSGIKDDTYETSLNSDEIAALLGAGEGLLNPDRLPAGATVDTTNSSRLTNGFATCSLKIGSIPLKDGNKTLPFSANITIEIIGTAVDAEENQRFVRTFVRTRAQFYGI